MSGRLWVALATLCVAGRAGALDPAQPIGGYARNEWSQASGLPSGQVVSIGQGSDGYFWLGTAAGLVRFDGRVFTSVERAAPVLGYWVRAQARDRDGALWAVGERGAVRVDGDGLALVDAWTPGPLLRSVAPARRGGVWVGSNGAGFVRLDRGGVAERPAPSVLDHALVSALVETPGELWVAAFDRGLYRYPGGDVSKPPIAVAGPTAVRVLLVDRAGHLWVGHNGGLARRDGDAFVSLAGLEHHAVCAIAEDDDGALWLGTTTGLFRLHGDAIDRPAGADPLAQDTISALAFDRDGGLLVGTLSGHMVRLADSAFHRYALPGGSSAHELCRDGAGTIYVGGNGGVARLRDGAFTRLGGAGRTDQGSFISCATTSDGTVYMGARGLYRVDGDELVPVPLAPRGRAFDGYIVALAAGADGGLWIGAEQMLLGRARDGTLTVFDGAAGFAPGADVDSLDRDGAGRLLVRCRYDLYLLDGAALTRLETGASRWSAVGTDRDGTLWLAAQDGTIAHLSGGRIVASAVVGGTPAPFVSSISDDGAGHWWLGARAGLARLPHEFLRDLVAGRPRSLPDVIRFYDLADGLPSVNISERALAHDGHLWLGTDRGAVSVDLGRLERISQPPPVVIERVEGDAGQQRTSDRISFAAGTRAIEIAYTAPTLAASDHVRFRYRLEGFDRGWVDAGTRRTAQYTALPPGRYTFSVLAGNRDGAWSHTPARVTLEIAPRLYQRRSVQALLALALALLIWALHRRRLARVQARARELAAEVAARTAELRDRNQLLGQRSVELEQALESVRLAQVDLVRAERMASVAALVRGIAHELNNPIAFIAANVTPLRRYADFLLGLSRRLQEGVPSLEEWRELSRYRPGKGLDHVTEDLARLTEDIAEGARRARLIIGDLQHLTGEPSRQVETVDLAALVARTVRLFGSAAPDVRIEADVTPVPPLRVYAGQLEQALTNLIDNAVKARPRDGRVRVRLRATATAIELAVIDRGQGMSGEVRRRALEPFFTTRAVGEGSGLGLTIVSAAVTAHQGTLTLDSDPEGGTTVVMTFPLEGAVVRQASG